MMKSQTDFDRPSEAQTTLPDSIRYRLDVVFAAAALTVLAGLLIPIPVRILDIAWIVGICLAAAVVVVCLIAKSCHDLQGFGFLAGALVLLRIGLTAMTVRKILVEHTASAIIDLVGRSVQDIGAIGAAVIAVLLAMVGFGSLFPAAGWIRQASQHFAGQILPIKRAGLQAELSLKGIPPQQARQVLEKIRTEMQFYGSMGAVAVLMRCEAVAGLVLIVAALAIKVFTDAFTAGYNQELLETLACQATGLVLVSVLPAVAAGWACAMLARRDSLCLKVVDSPAPDKGQKIKLSGRDGREDAEVELLNPDFVAKARKIEQAQEKIAEFETDKKLQSTLREYPVGKLQCSNLEEYYQHLTGVLQAVKPEKNQAILLTSPADTSLGINIAVNAAIGLARGGQKVLLIDIEPHRCAAAKAFDMDASKTLSGPQKTCIENLSIFTAGNTENHAIQRTLLAMDKLHEQYDRFLIYGPQRLGILAGKSSSRFIAVILVKPPQGASTIQLDTAIVHPYASFIVMQGPDTVTASR